MGLVQPVVLSHFLECTLAGQLAARPRPYSSNRVYRTLTRWLADPGERVFPVQGGSELKIKENQTEEISVVYIAVPELNVSIDRQRYTCLILNRRYRFEQIDTGFVREIEIDENGFVIVYPGLFKRIQESESETEV